MQTDYNAGLKIQKEHFFAWKWFEKRFLHFLLYPATVTTKRD